VSHAFRLPLAAAYAMLALVAGCGGGSPEARSVERAERGVAVAVFEVVARDLSLSIEVTGAVEPIREVRLAARMSGIVSDVRVEEGDRVRAGAVLARFDVSEQEAERSRAQTRLEVAEAHYQRAAKMRAEALLSEVDYENTRAELALARSEVRLWDARLAFGLVVAPHEGVVTAKSVERGSAVGVGDLLFVIADTSTLVVRVGLSDVHVPKLRVGQAVRVRIDALPGRTWSATIRRIFPSADPDTRLVPVEFALEKAGAKGPMPGYLARLDVDVEPRPGVLAVPSQAMRRSEAGDPFVFVIDDGRLVRRDVVPGTSRRDWTEIVEGLTPGDLVVGSSAATLREGLLVRVTESVPSSEGAAR